MGAFHLEPLHCELIWGGIAKGAAMEAALSHLRNVGAKGGLVDLGGNIGVFGESEDTKTWNIQIQLPKESRFSSPILSLSDGFVSTSSLMERKFRPTVIRSSSPPTAPAD